MGLTLVSKPHGVLFAASLPKLELPAPKPAEGLGPDPNPPVGRGYPRLGQNPDGRGRPQPKPPWGWRLGRPVPVGKDGNSEAGTVG